MRRHCKDHRSTAATFALLILSAVVSGGVLAAEVYRWVDSNGVVHYSDVPDGKNVERLAVQTHRATPPVADSGTDQQARLARERDFREQQEAQDAQAAAAARADVQRQREENCQQARERLENYLNARRLYRPMPDGERVYLSDQELDAARAEARQAVEQWCGNGSS